MTEFTLANRVKDIPEYAFASTEKQINLMIREGKDVIKLHIGSPDLPAPPEVIDSLYNSALIATHHGYGGFSGIPTLRQAFADYYQRRFAVTLDPATQIIPLLGSKEGLFNLSLMYLNPGDMLIVPDPGYPTYEIGARVAGATLYPIPLKEENGFLPDLAEIPADIARKAKMMWVCYPNNPTGAVAAGEDYARIVEFCIQNNILLCSDNPYCDVTFGDYQAPSVLQVPGSEQIAVEFNSLSKTYNMAGWRVGVCAGNSQIVAGLASLKSNIDSGIFRAIQDAAVTALTEVSDQWLQERNLIYQRRRDVIMQALPRIGLSANTPRAGLYVWARVLEGDDLAYVGKSLNEAHVSVAPGSLYGKMGEGYVRFSLVQDEERLKEAAERLTQAFSR